MSAKKRTASINPPDRWCSRAPASLMLFGEHAVLHGYPAIACAVDHWLEIDWQLSKKRQGCIEIHSHLATHETRWDELTPHPKLQFVMAVLTWLKSTISGYSGIRLPSLRLNIKSDINSTQGLGSSSAVMAALLVGLTPLMPYPMNRSQNFMEGRRLIQQVQGAGSGTDLACALTGGVIHLTPYTQQIEVLSPTLPLISVYVGYKTPTPEVIQRVERDWLAFTDLHQYQLLSISQVTHYAKQAIQQDDLPRLGRLMNMAHGLMHGLGVSDPQLDLLVHQLRQYEGILGAKISGSGLGDCVIALGTTHTQIDGQISLSLTPLGAHIAD